MQPSISLMQEKVFTNSKDISINTNETNYPGLMVQMERRAPLKHHFWCLSKGETGVRISLSPQQERMESLKLRLSPARRHFKQRIGQVNHFLITTLIGLDGVKSKEFTLPEEFRTSWNPRSVERSAERSIRFILDASLSWVVDNLDSYFTIVR